MRLCDHLECRIPECVYRWIREHWAYLTPAERDELVRLKAEAARTDFGWTYVRRRCLELVPVVQGRMGTTTEAR